MAFGKPTTLLISAILAALVCRLHVQGAPTAPIVRLLSDEAGRFIGVSKSGEVHAKAHRLDAHAQFYLSQPNGIQSYRFESVAYPGNYLMISNGSSENGTLSKALKCGTPTQDNDIFERVMLLGNIEAFKQADNCFMAFDEDGEPVAPCGLSQTLSQVQIVLDDGI